MAQSDAPLAVVRMDHAEAEKYGQIFAKGRACLVRDLPTDVIPFRLAAVVMAGHELGFSPFTSIAGISIVEGKPRLSYQLTGALVRRSGRYDYRVQEISDERATIEFLELDALAADSKERWRSLGTSTFSIQDAARADLTKKDVWKKYPRNMLFARALTQGVNFYCPDVAAGCPIFSEDDDLGGSGEREVVARAVAVAAPVQPAPKQEKPKQLETKPAETVQASIELAKAQPATPEAICAAAEAQGAPASQAVKIDATTTLTASTTPLAQSMIVRSDGTSVPPDHASAAIDNARQETAQAKAAEKPAAEKPKRSRAKKTDRGAAATAQEGAPNETQADALAQSMGVQPGDGPLAPATQAARPVDPKHPGLVAFQLQDELAKLGLASDARVDGKLASRVHACGVNSYGSDAAARAAWQSVGYSLPKKGDQVQGLPSAKQVDGYLATIVQREEEKEREAESRADW